MTDGSTTTAFHGAPRVDPAPEWVDRLSAVTDPCRLAVLATLRDASELPIEELSTRVVDRLQNAEYGSGADDVTPESLYHVHLPVLDEAGVVEVADDAGGTGVRLGPTFDEGAVDALERALRSGAVDQAMVSALEEPRRRRTVSVLSTVHGPVGLDGLVEAVSAVRTASGPAVERTRDLAVTLHHVDLPTLAAAGLVVYDPETRTVTYRGLPDELSMVVAGR